MQDKDEIIYIIRAEWGNNTSGVEQLCQAVWNAAIDMAAESASIDGEWITNDLGNDVCICGTLDKESITSLKFKTDEK